MAGGRPSKARVWDTFRRATWSPNSDLSTPSLQPAPAGNWKGQHFISSINLCDSEITWDINYRLSRKAPKMTISITLVDRHRKIFKILAESWRLPHNREESWRTPHNREESLKTPHNREESLRTPDNREESLRTPHNREKVFKILEISLRSL